MGEQEDSRPKAAARIEGASRKALHRKNRAEVPSLLRPFSRVLCRYQRKQLPGGSEEFRPNGRGCDSRHRVPRNLDPSGRGSRKEQVHRWRGLPVQHPCTLPLVLPESKHRQSHTHEPPASAIHARHGGRSFRHGEGNTSNPDETQIDELQTALQSLSVAKEVKETAFNAIRGFKEHLLSLFDESALQRQIKALKRTVDDLTKDNKALSAKLAESVKNAQNLANLYLSTSKDAEELRQELYQKKQEEHNRGSEQKQSKGFHR